DPGAGDGRSASAGACGRDQARIEPAAAVSRGQDEHDDPARVRLEDGAGTRCQKLGEEGERGREPERVYGAPLQCGPNLTKGLFNDPLLSDQHGSSTILPGVVRPARWPPRWPPRTPARTGSRASAPR